MLAIAHRVLVAPTFKPTPNSRRKLVASWCCVMGRSMFFFSQHAKADLSKMIFAGGIHIVPTAKTVFIPNFPGSERFTQVSRRHSWSMFFTKIS